MSDERESSAARVSLSLPSEQQCSGSNARPSVGQIILPRPARAALLALANELSSASNDCEAEIGTFSRR